MPKTPRRTGGAGGGGGTAGPDHAATGFTAGGTEGLAAASALSLASEKEPRGLKPEHSEPAQFVEADKLPLLNATFIAETFS
mmetsp:Transcript_68219/g.148849  ORF Transcript_68219/g.148849 Transcript_68219/m.148849 type:complete len:82 (+) Transcript_68219:132-377(+)